MIWLMATLAWLAASPQPDLHARFIGNAGFELTDGASTILVDFPYQSGAFDYMTFPRDELRARPGALCLFTHQHADHFDAAAARAVGCTVAGPGAVQAAVPDSVRAGAGPVWEFAGARIECLSTPHAGIEHCSYLLRWHGVTIFISGDADDIGVLNHLSEAPDAIFLPYWMFDRPGSFVPTLNRLEEVTPRSQVIINHHPSNAEGIATCERCRLPRQGEEFRILHAPPPPEPR